MQSFVLLAEGSDSQVDTSEIAHTSAAAFLAAPIPIVESASSAHVPRTLRSYTSNEAIAEFLNE